MDESKHLLLFGASTRAAAFSALRAGLRPWCVDLFADRDLQARCDVRLAEGKYPQSFLSALGAAPPGPWLYTGGLENHPRLVRAMAERRELWGNNAATLRRARDPLFVAEVVRAAGLPAPAVCATPPTGNGRCWLVKPLCGAGGRDIALWDGDPTPTDKYYFQEFIEGEAVAAVYAANGRSAQLLGLTRQLIGASFCHATAFHYCGSIGPLDPGARLRADLQRLGDALTTACQLRGLFGVDGVLHDGTFWPVEVNPRYTASVEVLEYGSGLRAVAWHLAAFEPVATPPILPARSMVGKAVLMARQDVTFPDAGPWDVSVPLDALPPFADIPRPGERIPMGRPILTLFARAGNVTDCEEQLRRAAADLDRRLFGS